MTAAVTERYALVLKLRSEGKTFDEIATVMGISRGRVYQIRQAAKRWKDRQDRYTGIIHTIGITPDRVRQLLAK